MSKRQSRDPLIFFVNEKSPLIRYNGGRTITCSKGALAMYEKPQYLTPDGYRRMAKNPSKTASRDPNTALTLIRKKKTELLGQRSAPSSGPGGRKPVLSEEAAKAIAAAISGMLRK